MTELAPRASNTASPAWCVPNQMRLRASTCTDQMKLSCRPCSTRQAWKSMPS
jgi:hypothetical protein